NRLHPQQHCAEDQRIDQPEFARKHGAHRTRCGSKCVDGSSMHRYLSAARNVGGMQVSLNEPWMLPFSSECSLVNRKISCICTTSPSMPVISVTLTTLRRPSGKRCSWIRIRTADAI